MHLELNQSKFGALKLKKIKMIKPQKIREQLENSVQFLRDNPDKLHLFIDKGNVISTLAPSISFEYQYTLNIIVTDFGESADVIIVPILHWLREQQPDIFAHEENRRRAFVYEIDWISTTHYDISIDIKLTERVIVKEKDGILSIEHYLEPKDCFDE